MGKTMGKMQGFGIQRSAMLMAAAIAATYSGGASALEADVFGTPVKIENLITLGGTWRMQGRDSGLIGKSTMTPGVCVARVGDDGVSGPNPDPATNTFSGDTCSATRPDREGGDGTANDFFIRQPGAFSPNADNGNLSFEKHDLVQATAKVTTDFSFEAFGFNVFARSLYYFDDIYVDHEEEHPDTTLQASKSRYSGAGKSANGSDIRFLDYFISRSFKIGDRAVSVKVGDQVLNWGESAFLALNSLNTINAPNQVLLRFPGSDIKEVFQPQGMAVINADLFEGVGLEVFYQYEWKPIIVDPVGSFFSVSDTLGDGGRYAMLSFAKAPEDPDELYRPYRNPQDPSAVLGSQSDRTLLRNTAEENRRRPDDGGQYGAALKFFLEDFNNGTEVGLYFANYHSRVPSVSAIAADATCIPDAPIGTPVDNLLGLLNPMGCAVPLANFLALALQQAGQDVTYQPANGPAGDALPVGSAQLVVEYPEDIRMYGISFNTTIGDFAWAGEYVFRDNLPLQIHTTDLIFAALQPAFPANDYSLGVATLPGRRTAVPDFITQYRGIDVGANDYIRGYERMKIGQLGTNILKLVGGDNPLGASQITLLLEMGLTHVVDMPGLDELQFNGGGNDTHISGGADGSIGINPRDVRTDPNDPTTNGTTATLRQNPIAHEDRGGFGTEISYGYRFVTLTRYDNAFLGVNIELLNALFHDVEGVAPGLGQNFVEGRKTVLSGIRWDYLSKYSGELRYTWFTGGKDRDAARDRDNLLLFLGYSF
ncbi:MAG TPA: DUF1302 family protein [Solimonas sp.]|nr:DUF1302 family protein [Solimonas sp.]